MKLYFGNMVTTVTTIMVIALVGLLDILYGICGYGACKDYTVRCICLHKMDMKLYRSAGLRESLA